MRKRLKKPTAVIGRFLCFAYTIIFIGPLNPHRERERVAEDATTQTVQSLVRPHQLSGIAQLTRVLLRATINLKLADFDISTVAHHTLLVILENCE